MVYALAVALLLSGVALMTLTVASVIGPFRFLGGKPEGTRPDLALWVPAQARAATPAERMRRLRAWRAASGRTRDVQRIERLDEAGPRVVGLPDARSLGPDELEALAQFLRSGGGAVLSGAVGVRGGDGSWQGWEPMAALLEVPRIVPRDTGDALLVARRGPLTAPLDPGRRIALHSEPGVPALEDPEAELQWAGAEGAAGASRRRSVGRGRLVWLGAGPETLDEQVGGQIYVGGEMPELLDAAIAWAAREPFVEVLPWPTGAPLGALLERSPDRPELLPASLAQAATPGARRSALERAIGQAVRSGALFRLAVPGAALAEPQRSALLDDATVRLRRQGAWFGERGDVAEWRRLRAGLSASTERVGPARRLVVAVNRNRETVRGAVLRVHLNDSLRGAEVGRTTLQQQQPVVRMDRRRERLDIVLPDLPGGSQTAYTLDLQPLTEIGL
jgi:hypothetical protein